MRAAVLALSGAIALGGCTADKLTLLENEEGDETGSVAILDPVTGEEKVEVNTKLTEAKLTNRPKPRMVKELKPAYTTLLGDLPPKAVSWTILFPVGKSEIPEQERFKLGEIKQTFESRKGAQVEVAGFTDSTGTEEGNSRLSRDRALSVAAELRAFDIPVDDNVDTVGRGWYLALERLGLNKESDDYRRVDIVVR